MIFLTAPVDLQGTGSYESSLRMLHQRYGAELVLADRDPSENFASYDAAGKQVDDPSGESSLYVLAREDGTISVEVYRQWEHLCEEHGVPGTLLFPVGESAAELGNFTVSLLEEGNDRSFALVIPEAVTSNAGGSIPEAWRKSR